MMRGNVKLRVQDMRTMQAQYTREVDRSAARGLNRGIDKGRTTGSRTISRVTKIKVREVNARMSVRGATPQRLHATLTAHPYSPNLKAFNATPNKKGVAATAWEGRKTYKHAFIHPKTRRVVTRTTNKRYPLKGLKGPSVRRTFQREDVLDVVDQAATTEFEAVFAREVTRRIG